MAHIINPRDEVKEYYLRWYRGYSVKTLSGVEEALNSEIKRIESQRAAVRETIEKIQQSGK